MVCGEGHDAAQRDDIRLIALHRGEKLLRRHIDAEVHHIEAVQLEQHLHDVLADVVDVVLHDADEHLAAFLLTPLKLFVADEQIHRLD